MASSINQIALPVAKSAISAAGQILLVPFRLQGISSTRSDSSRANVELGDEWRAQAAAKHVSIRWRGHGDG